MSDLPQAIDNIRGYLDAGASVPSDRLRENAQTYAEACKRINDRLAECSGLLSRGLRSEAIHQAQLDPPLLDQFAVLDFPGSDRWAEISTSCGVPTPLLQVRLAQQLNAAFGEELPLAELLKKHRRLALSKADLKERIKTLRKIAEIDRTGLHWDDDIRALERARVSELKETFDRAKREQDYDEIRALHDELLSLEWREIPEEQLVQAVDRALDKVKEFELRQQFEQWEAALAQTIADRNVAQARAARAQIQTLIESNRISLQDPILRTIPDMLTSLAREEAQAEKEKQFDAAVRKLQQISESPEGDFDAARRAYDEVARFGYQVPRRAEEAYRVLEMRDAGRKRRKQLRNVGGLLIVLILVGAGVVVYALQAREKRKAREDAAVFRTHVEAADFRLAQETYAGRASEFDADPELRPFVDKMKLFFKDQEVKKAAFERLLANARGVKEADPNAPSVIQLALDSPLIDEATKRELNAKLELIRKNSGERRAELNEEFRRKLKELVDAQEKFDKLLEGTRRDESPAVLKDVAALLKELDSRKGQVDPVEAEPLAACRDRYQTEQKALDSFLREKRVVEAFDLLFENATFDPRSYVAKLDEEAKADPTSRRAADFAVVAKESKAWEAQLAWEVFLGRAGDLADEPEAFMGDRAAAMSNFLRPHRSFVTGAQAILPKQAILDYENYLKAYTDREGATRVLLKELDRDDCKNLFAQKLAKNPEGPPYYYFLKDPTEEIARTRTMGAREFVFLDAVVSRDALKRGETTSRKIPIADLLKTNAATAPQVILVGSVRDKLSRVRPSGWDKVMIEALDQIARDQSIEPILRADLALSVLKAIEKGNPLLAAQLADARKALTEVDPNFKWIDPNEKDVSGERDRALKGLKLIPEPARLLDGVRAARGAITARLKAASHPPKGWYHLGPGGRFESRTPNKVLPDGYLYVIAAEGEANPRWVKVATISGSVKESNVSEGRVEGRPLFYSKDLIP